MPVLVQTVRILKVGVTKAECFRLLIHLFSKGGDISRHKYCECYGRIVGTLQEQSIEQMASLLTAPTGEDAVAMTDMVATTAPVLTDSLALATDSIAEEGAELVASIDDYITMLRTTTEQIKAMTPIDMTLGMLSNNLSWSIIVALPVAAFLTIKKRK